MINLVERDITESTLAIVCFGPATPTTGLRPADYYQVTIDPNACSPSGQYIRFGLYRGDEITGWQRIAAMTIVEILGQSMEVMPAEPIGYTKENMVLTMMAVE